MHNHYDIGNANKTPVYHTSLCYLSLLFMTLVACLVSYSLAEAGLTHSPAPLSVQTVYEITNGQWFDGETFQRMTFYAKDGHLTKTRPAVVDEVINLDGGFVLPPFGEAHTHKVEGPWNIEQAVVTYLKHGVFYVKNPNSIRTFTEQIRGSINIPQSIDVTFAHAGLTSSMGHPVALYEDFLRVHRYEPFIGQKKRGWFKGRGYFTIDSKEDFDLKWPRILLGKPDFLKIYVGHSMPSDATHTSTTPYFRQGLKPDLIPLIVKRAHEHGLRVSAHVETADDFREAVLGGVDEIAHTPGWYLPDKELAARTVLQKQDAELAARHNVTVVTTTVASLFPPSGHHQPSHAKPHSHASNSLTKHQKATLKHHQHIIRDVLSQNLRLLHGQGVNLAIGSDHAETSLAEALFLHQLGIFHNLTLLKLWCENTAETIFPHRKIGKLEEGYEASFIVLPDNPIQNFQEVRHISFRMKQGRPLLANSSFDAQ
ncbi:MAG: hypothetical protein NPIRA02_27120 [Nitrospirales bacterium]|nr:MAG: hypothetical protein NPIRA02_27120 [Nitrospirales bacterium]